MQDAVTAPADFIPGAPAAGKRKKRREKNILEQASDAASNTAKQAAATVAKIAAPFQMPSWHMPLCRMLLYGHMHAVKAVAFGSMPSDSARKKP